MFTGRPRIPTAIHVLHGTGRADRLNTREPKPRSAINGKPPSWLLARPRRAWREVAPMLERLGVLTEADQIAFAMLCQAKCEWLELVDLIAEFGRTYSTTTASGDVMIRPRPEVLMASDAFTRLERMLTNFGMTPASRGRIASTLAPEGDTLEALLG